MDVFSQNLKNLARLKSQKNIALKTGMSQASIANYISGQSEPSANFLLELKNKYDISIDEFLTKELDFLPKEETADFPNKFLGNYIVYYYNSSAYKGQVGSYNSNILTYGVISVYKDKGFSAKNKCLAAFVLTKEQAEEQLKILNEFNGEQTKLVEFYKKQDRTYHGKATQNAKQLFINLTNDNDNCLIILNNPPTPHKYIGGIGTANSISRGREQLPCVQYIVVSSVALKRTEGEIYNLLTLGLPDVNIKNETNELILLFKNLYISQNNSTLNEFQKKRIIEDSLSNIIYDVVDANLFRFAKVSNMEDDNYYRLIKEDINE